MSKSSYVDYHSLLFGAEASCPSDATPDEWDEGIAESQAMLEHFLCMAKSFPDNSCYRDEIKFWRGFIEGQKKAKREALGIA